MADDVFALLKDYLKEIRDNQNQQSSLLLRHAESLARINETLSSHDENLKEHMRRSEANEIRIEQVELETLNRIKPIEVHVDRVGFVFKIIGFLAVAAALVELIYNIFN